MSFGAGYYGSDPYEDADEYEDFEEQPRQRSAPKSPGLRAYLRQIQQENKQLKKELEGQKAMLEELMEGDTPQLSSAGYPVSRLTQEEQLQLTRMTEMGVVGIAPPSGTQDEQIRAIRAARSPQELTEYLRSQGSVVGSNYEGQGFGY